MVVAIRDKDRDLFSSWTQIDGDTDGLDAVFADALVSERLGYANGDRNRAPYWSVPSGVDCINDIDFAGDASRAHRLDLYLPHDAVVRGGCATPVYIDIHGGGFIYGYKELNRNFCTHLADEGFAVFSLNYRLFPQSDFLGQLADVMQGLRWISKHMGEYPIDGNNVFITGDSAGGTLGLYALAIERSDDVAKAFGMEPAGLNVKGAAFVSGLFDISSYVQRAASPMASTCPTDASPMGFIEYMAPHFFKSLNASSSASLYTDLDTLLTRVPMPPMFLNTSNDDFIQDQTLKLAMCLSRHGYDFQLNDAHAAQGESLGHVYPVCMSWLKESRRTIHMIRDFTYQRL